MAMDQYKEKKEGKGRVALKRIAVAVALVFLFFSALSLFTYLRWFEDQYFGEVVEVKNGDLVLRTGSDGNITVHTDALTVIKKGRIRSGETLKIGEHVIVVGLPAEQGAIKASVIRIVKPPKPKNP